MERVDVVVVGAGIAGASAAYELAAHGDVALVEREPVAGYHTTGRSAALYTESYEKGPVQLLTLASGPFLRDPPDDFVDHPLLTPLPVLYVATAAQLETLDRIVAEVAGRTELRRLGGEELHQACPALDPTRLVAGLLEPAAHEIDVHALHQGYLRGARRRGTATLLDTAVTALRRRDRRWEVRAGETVLVADVVVDAAGAWADEVAVLADVEPLGLTPLRRTAFTFGAEGHDLTGWPMVVDADERFYFKPERDQLMGSLADETPSEPCDARPEEIDVALAIERITAVTDFTIRSVRRTWAGLRTFSPDRLPVVGFEPTADGFLWLAGQGGFGIMTAPAMARLAAAIVAGGPLPDGIDPDLAAAVAPGRLR
ncbi:MAG TPA: FAD-binding oxidoreductase [Actinobacteria bacterium]|nr:FAD-binding oxidoreductase [Actinomycetota bacterium]